MDFEWSEAKRLRVLKARNLDFIDAQATFDGRPICLNSHRAAPKNAG